MEDFVIKEKKNENRLFEIQKEIKEKNNKIDDKNQKLKYLAKIFWNKPVFFLKNFEQWTEEYEWKSDWIIEIIR